MKDVSLQGRKGRTFGRWKGAFTEHARHCALEREIHKKDMRTQMPSICELNTSRVEYKFGDHVKNFVSL